MNTNDAMSGRVNVVLSDEVHEVLKSLAQDERRSLSQMSAILIEDSLRSRKLLDNKPKEEGKGVA